VNDLKPRPRARRSRTGDALPGYEFLEPRNLLAADWLHNADMPTDVNNDHQLTPIDALIVINELNDSGGSSRRAVAATGPMFYDVNGDESLTPIDALMVINALNAEGENGMMLRIRLEVVDASNNPITSPINVGDGFILRGHVLDLTARPDGGVFSAFLDVNYDEDLVAVDGPITYSPDYPNFHEENISVPGILNEVGAIDGITPLGPAERLLFSLPFEARATGVVNFDASEADISPRHDSLLFEIDDPLTIDQIMYVDTSITIGNVTAPVAVNDAYETNEGTLLIVSADDGVLDNDTDPNGDPLTARLITTTPNGTLTLNANGSFTYTPNAAFTGDDTFTYVANDGTEDSNTATVTITVNPGNAAPVAVADTYSTNEDTLLNATTSVLANDTDADGDTLTAVLKTNTTNGTLTLRPDGTFTYNPRSNFNGTDTFTYAANDGQVESAVATVTINVTAVNDAPVAVADTYSTSLGTALNVDQAMGVLRNDTDVEGNGLTAAVVTPPSNGSLTLNPNGSFTYTPNATFAGTDTFTYNANDGTTNSLTPATVTINVTGEIAVRIILRTVDSEGNEISGIGPGGEFTLQALVQDVSDEPRDGVFAAYMDILFDNDLVTAGSEITYGTSYPNVPSGTIVQNEGLIDEVGAIDGLQPLGGGELLLFSIPFTAAQLGAVTFQSEAPDILPDHDILLFQVDDPIPVDQVEFGSVSLDIVSGNPPTANNDAYTTSEDTPLTVPVATGVLSNDINPNPGALTAVLVTGPANGDLTLNTNGSFTYAPDLNFNGTDTFTYRATAGPVSSNVATVTITISAVDDAPVAVNDSYRTDTAEPLVVDAAAGVLANDSDAEGDSLSAELLTNPSNGTLVLNADGSFTYTPTNNAVGRDTFTYRALAGGKTSEPATVTIDVGDQRPSSISGFVYVDGDNDGRRLPDNLAFGGVTITLVGTNLLGEEVRQSVKTAANGSYQFTNILRGNYTVTETQPIFIIDGKDTRGGDLSLRNDRFIIDLPGGTNLVDVNFGERGLEPQFIGNPLFFASRSKTGMYAAIDPSGEQAWYCFDAGWSNLASIDMELSENGSTLELTGVDLAGDTITASATVAGNRNVRILGNMQQGLLVRLHGTSEDFDIVSSAPEGELDPAAVDAAFGGPG
jgi:VCBS repeat-containing protein